MEERTQRNQNILDRAYPFCAKFRIEKIKIMDYLPLWLKNSEKRLKELLVLIE